MPEGVLAAADEGLGVLPPHGLAVALARVTEDGPKQVGATAFAVRFDPGALTEVDLHLLARGALHPPERERGPRAESAHEAFDRLVAAGETVLATQVLVDPLRRQPALQPCGDECPVRLAPAGRTGHRAGGRVAGWFCQFRHRGPGGRVRFAGWFWFPRPGGRVRGWFCHRRVPLHGLAIHAQLTRDPSLGPATLR